MAAKDFGLKIPAFDLLIIEWVYVVVGGCGIAGEGMGFGFGEVVCVGVANDDGAELN